MDSNVMVIAMSDFVGGFGAETLARTLNAPPSCCVTIAEPRVFMRCQHTTQRDMGCLARTEQAAMDEPGRRPTAKRRAQGHHRLGRCGKTFFVIAINVNPNIPSASKDEPSQRAQISRKDLAGADRTA